MEACIEAARWLERLASIHRSGSFVIIDYGYSTRELPRLSAGTIMSYRHHHASADFLSDPGQRDITSHVNFSFLRDVALRSGYRIVREVSLREWVHQVWGEEAFAAVWSSRDQRWRLQWKQLSMGMGETFRVLELSRSNPEDAPRPEEK